MSITNNSYPRTLLAGIAAALAAGGLAGYLITSLVVGTITAQTVTVTTLTATSTVNAITANATTTNTGALNVSGYGALQGAAGASSTFAVPNAATTLAQLSVTGTTAVTGSSTWTGLVNAPTGIQAVTTSQFTLGGGTAVDKILSTTANIDVDSMGAGQSTSTNVTLTGASVGDDCNVTVTAGDFYSTTSTGQVGCRVSSTDTVNLTFYNATPTAAFNAGMSTFRIKAVSF